MIRFRSRTTTSRVYPDTRGQFIIEDDRDDEGNQEITTKRIDTTTPSLRALRATYTLVTVFWVSETLRGWGGEGGIALIGYVSVDHHCSLSSAHLFPSNISTKHRLDFSLSSVCSSSCTSFSILPLSWESPPRETFT